MPTNVDVSAKPRSAKVARFFAHPATLTVVGGIVLALLTTLFQFCSAKTQQALVFKQQLRDKKFALLAAVAEEFHRDLGVLPKIKKMKAWLRDNKEGDMFEGSLGRDEVSTLYQKLYEQYQMENKTSALMAQVEALFSNPQVREEAQQLREQFMNLDAGFWRDPNLSKVFKETDDKLRKLEKAMADEINDT